MGEPDSSPSKRRRAARKDAIANRRSLLDAATRVFSKKGFRGAKVRDICREAGMNVGAVNQHFGSKEKLYREVIVLAGKSLAEAENCPRLEDHDDPEDALLAWMDYHLTLVLLRRARDPVAGPLLMREFRDPTDAIEGFAASVIVPIRAELMRIVGALLGEHDSPRLRVAGANFVYGLGVFHAFAAPVLARLGQPTPANKRDVDRLLALLFPFALGGIRELAEPSR